MGAGAFSQTTESIKAWSLLTHGTDNTQQSSELLVHGYPTLTIFTQAAFVEAVALGGDGLELETFVSVDGSGNDWFKCALGGQDSLASGTATVTAIATTALSVGATSVTLSSGTGFAAGGRIFIADMTDLSTAEVCTIASVSGAVLTLVDGVQYEHAVSETVSNLVWESSLSLVPTPSIAAATWNGIVDPGTIKRVKSMVWHLNATGPNVAWRSFVGYSRGQL